MLLYYKFSVSGGERIIKAPTAGQAADKLFGKDKWKWGKDKNEVVRPSKQAGHSTRYNVERVSRLAYLKLQKQSGNKGE